MSTHFSSFFNSLVAIGLFAILSSPVFPRTAPESAAAALAAGPEYRGYLHVGGHSDYARAMAVDAQGCAYVAGTTSEQVGYVIKISADGRNELYRHLFPNTWINDVTVDVTGRAIVVGMATDSSREPVSCGPDITYNGGGSDAFLACLTASGTEFDFAGYIGGAFSDSADCVALDAAGNIYVGGHTHSGPGTFPVTIGPLLAKDPAGDGNQVGFVAKVRADGSGLDYCGYVSGTGTVVSDIAVDSSGRATFCGSSRWGGLPVTVGPRLNFDQWEDPAYVARIRSDGSGFEYCGYIASVWSERYCGATAVTVDNAGHAYVAGYVSCDYESGDWIDLPVTGGPSLTYNGGNGDGWVAKVAEDGSGFEFCGFIGGADYDYCSGIALDAQGGIWICGATYSSESSFPVLNGPDLTLHGVSDAFFVHIKNDGSRIDWGSFLGGACGEGAVDMAVSPDGALYLAGSTCSDESSFPVAVGPNLVFNRSAGNASDAFVARFHMPELILVTPNGGESWTLGSPHAINWTATNYSGTVNLVLFNGNTRVGTIATGLSAASGTYAWTVGNYVGGTVAAGGSYRIRVRSPDNTLGDYSDTVFTIAAKPSLALTAPNGGESWPLGESRAVTWTATNYSGKVNLILFNGNIRVGTIVTGLRASAGTYAWTVGSYVGGTAAVGSSYRIRVRSTDNTLGDNSDAMFTVVPK